jgi:mannose-6-phosphate isomerase-like protein (cupin superfamily)
VNLDVSARPAAVIHEADLPMLPTPDGAGTYREPIGRANGCRRLVQRVIRYAPGRSELMRQDRSETVTFVIAGKGRLTVDTERVDLAPDTALFIPPGTTHAFEANRDQGLLLVSVLSPPPAGHRDRGGAGAERGEGWGVAARSAGPTPPRRPHPTRPATTRTADQDPIPAGDDRFFKLLIDPRFGCRNVTQFVGFIERSRAPFHTHAYEEVLYVLEGDGIVHVDERHVPIRTGTSVFLPPGVPHCLQNAGDGVLRLLGVFSPAGSPADKREG